MFCLFVFSPVCLDVFGSGIRKSLRTCIPKKLSRRLTKTKQKTIRLPFITGLNGAEESMNEDLDFKEKNK